MAKGIRVLSPDGIDMYNGMIYNTRDQAMADYNKWVKGYENQGYYSSNKGRIALNELINHMTFLEVEPVSYCSVAVIDLSIPSLSIYDVNEDWSVEEIEEHLYTDRGHHLSNCSWGVFEGEINDERNV